jgi:hypothetical protein
MRHRLLLAAATLTVLVVQPASAGPCEDDIRALDARVNDASGRSAALSGGGEGVAASRQAQAMQADAKAPAAGQPAQKLPEHDVNATSAVTPLGGGDKPMKAKAALDRARTLERDGNAAGCAEAVAEARRELGSGQ